MILNYIIIGFLVLSCLFFLWYIRWQKKSLSSIISEMIDEFIENVIPCKLILISNFNQKEDSIVFDFSHYEKEDVVVMIKTYKEEAKDTNEKLIDGKIIYYPRAVVYKLGEQWLWQT